MDKADSLSSPIEARLCPVKWPRLSLAAAVSVPVYIPMAGLARMRKITLYPQFIAVRAAFVPYGRVHKQGLVVSSAV